jgi:excisionase family DNA binding protein
MPRLKDKAPMKETIYETIAQQIYTGAMKIGDTSFYHVAEFIDAQHERAEFKGALFYDNVGYALGWAMNELHRHNQRTDEAINYVASKSKELYKPNATAQAQTETHTRIRKPGPEILTQPQLAERLNVVPETIWKWRKKGKIPFLKIGRSIRFDYDKVVEAIKKNDLI